MDWMLSGCCYTRFVWAEDMHPSYHTIHASNHFPYRPYHLRQVSSRADSSITTCPCSSLSTPPPLSHPASNDKTSSASLNLLFSLKKFRAGYLSSFFPFLGERGDQVMDKNKHLPKVFEYDCISSCSRIASSLVVIYHSGHLSLFEILLLAEIGY